MARAVNYLNNRDLLIEIHKSKVSHSWYEDPSYEKYDEFITEIDELFDQEFIAQAKKNKVVKLKKENSDSEVSESEILTGDLVFRYMTYSHIPEDLNWPEDKTKKKASDGHMKVNFPPYQHIILENGVPRVVGMSHHKDKEFCVDNGKMTEKLGYMFILLVEKISKKGNWRNYCVDEDTEALTQRGWLNIDKINDDDLILSYSYEDGRLKWSKIKSIYRGQFDGLMHKISTKSIDMLITPEHKLLTERGLIKAEYLLENDRIILMGNPAVGSNEKIYSDSFVEFVGWLVTEGSYEYTKNKIKCIRIFQNPREKANRIRKCLDNLGYAYTEKPNENGCVCFEIHKADSEKVHEILPEKNLTMDLIVSLTFNQRELLINTMIDGNKRCSQENKNLIDLFQALCTISGYRTNSHLINHISLKKMVSYFDITIFSHRKNYTRVECLDFHGGKRNGRKVIGRGKSYHPNEPTTYYNGRVWCPQTEYGCFMARRNGTVYLTGNTYIDEMKNSALLQLSQVGLQFDESRSAIPNPFAFFTTVVNNSFKRVLNTERKNRDIRDDLIEMAGQTPSFTRQMESITPSSDSKND